jgi:hypothetical protein
MSTCPWCDEDATSLIAESTADTFECPACGTCVDLVEEPAVLAAAA